MYCDKCNISCFKKPLYRVNPKGELPAIMMCDSCHPDMKNIDGSIITLANIIVDDNKTGKE